MIYLEELMFLLIVGICVGAIFKDSLVRIVKRSIKAVEDWSKEL